MKKNRIGIAVLAALCVLWTSLGAAQAVSVRPGLSALVRQMVAGQTFSARLTGYTWAGELSDVSLTFSLCEPETFLKEEIEALQEGDTVVVGGFPYEVISIREEEGVITVNKGILSTDTLVFKPQEDGSYTVFTDTDVPFWRGSVTVSCPVSPDAIFLDWSDPGAVIPSTYGLEELMDRLIDDAIFLTPNNTEITFDEEGRLSVLLYRYSPTN